MSPFDRRTFLTRIGISGFGAVTLAEIKAAEPDPGPSAAARDAIETDVLVVGAGSSGIPAAIAAARNGADVVLLEDDVVPGGAPVDMFVASPCGNPQVGIYREMLELLNEGHNFSLHPEGRATWFLPSSYVRVIMAMLGQLPNLRLMSGVRVLRALVGDGTRNRLEGVTIQRGGAAQEIRARMVIDATGTGELADMAGCESLYGREARSQHHEPVGPEQPDDQVQQCTWMFITHKLRPDAVFDIEKVRWTPNESGYGWIKRQEPESVAAFVQRSAGIYLHWGGHLVCSDTRDPVCLAETQLAAVQSVVELDGPALARFGYGMTLAPKLGMRESRRVVGEYVMTANDLTTSKWPDDVVSVGRYGLDAWGDKEAKGGVAIPATGYGIPYRALLAKGMENLLVVGKAVSSTHLAQSALRVQPIVSQMGQAAGIAAAMAVARRTSLRSLDVAALQERLREGGLLVPANECPKGF
jgi:hypothetical protein